MNKEFDVSFLGLSGTIDEEVAKAMFKKMAISQNCFPILRISSIWKILLIYISERRR